MHLESVFGRRGVLVLVTALAIAASGFGQTTCVTGTNAALFFDGNDWVRVSGGGAGVLDGFADFTLEGWARMSLPITQFPTIVARWGAIGQPYMLRVGAGGGVDAYFNNASGSISYGAAGLNDGNWHHVAVSRIGSLCTLYVDGTSVANTSFQAPLATTTSELSIGAFLSASGLPNSQSQGPGLLDEIRVWNVGRTQSQINSARLSVLSGNEPGLVGYWRLNEGGGQVLVNSAVATGAAANGTLGASNAMGLDDPTWSFADSAPLVYCAPGTGQANSAVASLRVNGVGSVGVPGPFQIMIPTTGPVAHQLTFTWAGTPNAPLLLLVGSPAPNSFSLPCLGSLDLSFGSLVVAGDYFTTPFPLNLLFILDGGGFAQTTFSIPAALLGTPWLSLQGAVFNPSCSVPYTLTAAFTVR